jgi:hypothetical protein
MSIPRIEDNENTGVHPISNGETAEEQVIVLVDRRITKLPADEHWIEIVRGSEPCNRTIIS